MTAGFERRAHVGVVVNLAVVGDPDRLVFVRQRLIAAGQINDAEPPVDEQCAAVRMKARAVRSTRRRAAWYLRSPRAIGRA